MVTTLSRVAPPRVTIAIPTLNRASYLRLALNSALAQTYDNLEIVVSNNASTDDTAEYLRSCQDPRVRVLHQQEQLTMVQNWNACVSIASGEYFLLLSDDDLLEPDAIRELVAGYAEGCKRQIAPGIVYCGGSIIDASGKETRKFKPSSRSEEALELIPAFFRAERDLWLCAILFRTADILPGFSVEYSWAPDSMIWIRSVVQHGSAVYIAKELVRYRVHQNTTSALPVAIWKRELVQLGQYAILQCRSCGRLDPKFSANVNAAIDTLIARSLPGRINETLGKYKLLAIREYGRNLESMMSPVGMTFLLKGLVSLFLPKRTKTWLRVRRKKLPASPE
jgi:glycosyltransferase involved in cell wall biosynthesis